jgi:alpha-N-arabinofuranosidase
MDNFIKTVAGICDLVKTRKHSKKTVNLSFDEWNVWYHSNNADKQVEKWIEAPPILEDIYTMEDALVAGCMLITLLKNADRVKVACLAQLVNVIAPIMTVPGGASWRQSIYYPFMDASCFGRGTVLRCPVKVDAYDSKEYTDIPYLESVAVYNEENSEITIFAVNRNLKESLELEADIAGFGDCTVIEHRSLSNGDLNAVNSAKEEKVKPVIQSGAKIEGTAGSKKLLVSLPPASWNVIRIKTDTKA